MHVKDTTKDLLDIKSPLQKIGIFFRRVSQVPKVTLQMTIYFAGMSALSWSKIRTDIQKSMDELLVIRTNQSILLCNDTVFLFPSVWGYRGSAVE